VIRDVLDPRRDPVRMSGMDDPAGGVLDGAEDVYGFGLMDDHYDQDETRGRGSRARHVPDVGSRAGVASVLVDDRHPVEVRRRVPQVGDQFAARPRRRLRSGQPDHRD
jgi:hypothetical protein